MTKKNYSKYEAKEELVTLSFNHVLLHKKDTKIYQVIFLSLLKTFRHYSLLTSGHQSITYMTAFPTPVTIKRISRTIQENSF